MGNLYLHSGNIVDDNILPFGDAVVNPTNPMMRFGGGACGAIYQRAGIDILESYVISKYKVDYFHKENEMKVTEVRITPGFNLYCDIIFAQGPKLYDYESFNEALNLLLKTYENVLKISVEKEYKSILVPALGTGSYGFTHEDTAKPVLDYLNKFARENELDIHFVIFDEYYYGLYFQYI